MSGGEVKNARCGAAVSSKDSRDGTLWNRCASSGRGCRLSGVMISK